MSVATKFAAGQTYHLLPGTLRLERNIRDAKPDQGLIDSVKRFGVLEPIVAVIDDNGGLIVRHGHRRTMAAVQAGTKNVPVYVAGTDVLEDQFEIGRVIAQRDENTHRAGLTSAEDAGVVGQLAAFGLSIDEISDQARIAKDRATTALTVHKSKKATKAAVDHDLTLDQALVIAEFETDAKASKDLLKAAKDGGFDHVASRLRQDRAEAEAIAALTKELTDAGAVVISNPGYDHRTIQKLSYLDDAKGKEITQRAHAKCPGAVVWVAPSYTWKGNVREITAIAVHGCKDFTKHGHTYRYGSGRAAAAELTPAQKEKAKAERRLVIDNNKAWAAAETVRREFITSKIVKLKVSPKGTDNLIATALVLDHGLLINDYRADPDKLAAEWLGVKGAAMPARALASNIAQASESHARHIALIYLLAVYELKAMGKNAWRNDGTSNDTGRYLRFLESAGYELSDVEKFAISNKRVS